MSKWLKCSIAQLVERPAKVKLSDLPADVLVRVLSYVPRHQHAGLAALTRALHSAVLAQPRSVLRFIDTFPCSGHDDVAPPPVRPTDVPDALRSLSHRIEHGANNIRVLRLHRGIPPGLRRDLLQLAEKKCRSLRHLAFADNESMSTDMARHLFRSFPLLTQIEVGNCRPAMLTAFEDLPSTCTKISLHTRYSEAFVPMLQAVRAVSAVRPEASLDVELFLYAHPDERETHKQVRRFKEALCETEATALSALSTFSLALGVCERYILGIIAQLQDSGARGRGATFLPAHTAMRLHTVPYYSVLYHPISPGSENHWSAHDETVTTRQLLRIVDATEGGYSLTSVRTLLVDNSFGQSPGQTDEQVTQILAMGSSAQLRTVHVDHREDPRYNFVAGRASLYDMLRFATSVCRAVPSVQTLRMSHDAICALEGRMLESVHLCEHVTHVQFMRPGRIGGVLAHREWECFAIKSNKAEQLSRFCKNIGGFLDAVAAGCPRVIVVSMEAWPPLDRVDDVSRDDVIYAFRRVERFCMRVPGADCSTLRAQFEFWLRELDS